VLTLQRVMTDMKGHMMLKRTTLAIGLLAAFALPATAVAAPPSKADKRHAAKDCKEERGTTDATREAFKAEYGNFGKCVSAGARERKAERKAARSSASRDCRGEREAMGLEAFREQYGSNRNGKNAFGKCVSAKAKEQLADEEQTEEQEVAETHSAAETCAGERDASGEQAFADKYGKNGNKRNAFGKCVSATARAQEADPVA
jgi:hypothetical protein